MNKWRLKLILMFYSIFCDCFALLIYVFDNLEQKQIYKKVNGRLELIIDIYLDL